MGSFSIWHWLILLVIVATYIVPVWKILTKAGYPGILSILTFVPIINFILLWVFAFSTWPRDRR